MAASSRSRFLYLLLCFLSTIILINSSSINVEELKSISYHLDILSSPVLSGQELSSSGSVMQITSLYGQEYQCNLPEAAVKFYGDNNAHGKYGSDLSSTDPADLGLLLKPMETSPCLTKTKDWWTYEFCYGKHIKQYHLQDNKIVSPVIVLGHYESEYNWNNDSKAEEYSRNRLQRYHSQYYVNGSTCDITGTQRRSEVRFLCEDGSGDYIHHVDEPESCRYIVTIHTTKVCHHPYLRLPPNNDAQSIVCNPVLTSDQYENYLIKEKEQKEKVEEKRKAWLAKQEERLSALKKSKEEAKQKEASKSSSPSPSSSKKEEKAEKDAQDKTKQADGGGGGKEKVSHKRGGSNGPTTKAEEPTKATLDADASSKNDYKPKILPKQMFKEDVKEMDRLNNKWQAMRDDIKGKMKEVKDQIKQIENDAKQGTVMGMELEILERQYLTLKNMLQQAEKAESDTSKASKGLASLQNYIDSMSWNSDNDDEVVTQKTEMEMEPATEVEKDDDYDGETSSAENDPEDEYQRFSEITKADEKDAARGGIEFDHDEETMGDIEKSLFRKLRESGIDTRGRKFEVKILTSDYFDEDDDNDADGSRDEDDGGEYQTVLIKLMGEDDDIIENIQHQERLEKNYRFTWDGGKAPADGKSDKKRKGTDVPE